MPAALCTTRVTGHRQLPGRPGRTTVALVLLGLTACLPVATGSYSGPESDNFDGRRFFNQGRPAEHGFFTFLKWVATRRRGYWPQWIEERPGPRPPDYAGAGRLRITFINHATMLVQMDGTNILTDPIWSERASPVRFLGPRRIRPPGIRFDDLPPIDAVVISHNHYDHLDTATLRRLAEKHAPRIFVPLGNSAVLAGSGIAPVTELDWWQQAPISDSLRVVCVPARHFSGRGITDHNRALWAGFVFESSSGSVYFAGDTGFGPHFEQIADRFERIRLAMLPIGAFRPRWFMASGHLSPDQALAAHAILGAQTSIAMHFGTFPLGDDAWDEPVITLDAVLKRAGSVCPRFLVLECGQGLDLAAVNGAAAVHMQAGREPGGRQMNQRLRVPPGNTHTVNPDGER